MQIVECPRDAMQGLGTFIPTKAKIKYLRKLMQVGFDVLDCGSFVSPKSIPQMADTEEVLNHLLEYKSNTQLSVIVANMRGVQQALAHPAVDILGYPFSMSKTFLKKNTKKSQEEAFAELKETLNLCEQKNRQLVVYFSMCFGNPYGDEWNLDIVLDWVEKFEATGFQVINLSDTVGMGKKENIPVLFEQCIPTFPAITFGAHLHTVYEESLTKIRWAFDAGCRRFDSAIQGFGGCPMSGEPLLGNMPTEKLITFAHHKKEKMGVKTAEFEGAYNASLEVFSHV